MKQLWRITERYYPWLLLLLGVDCFCAIILWISDIQAFQTLIGLVVLTSLLLFSVILFVLNKRETTRRELFRDFLSDPTICNEERLLSAISRKKENLSGFWHQFYRNTKLRVTVWQMPYRTMKNMWRAGHMKRKRPYRC